eukprot:TRINITY_DN4033_c0_g1_i4.p1 TRINITY_DN4033_c0_g1~~TRINITY_DN4033_c0_g1_i4.p1  ORF type:complete len:611 (-),score=107.33 TRINITY_DN4033_c0_g1_i4:203-2035(-)
MMGNYTHTIAVPAGVCGILLAYSLRHPFVLLALVIGRMWYVWICYGLWKADFAWRFPRSDPLSPSNKKFPQASWNRTITGMLEEKRRSGQLPGRDSGSGRAPGQAPEGFGLIFAEGQKLDSEANGGGSEDWKGGVVQEQVDTISSFQRNVNLPESGSDQTPEGFALMSGGEQKQDSEDTDDDESGSEDWEPGAVEEQAVELRRRDRSSRSSHFANSDIKQLQPKAPVSTLVAPTLLNRRSSALKSIRPGQPHLNLASDRSELLDMDHVHITFMDYLWGNVIITPCAYLLSIGGLLKLFVRQFLCKHGWLKPAPCEPEELVCRLILEGIGLVVYYVKKWQVDKDGDKETEACFVIPNLALLDAEGNMQIYQELVVILSLSHKKMVSARLEEQTLTASETAILLTFHLTFNGHPKIHAHGNWAVNTEARESINAFVHQNSVVSVLYNYFGKTIFPRVMNKFFQWGITSSNFPGLPGVIAHAGMEGVVAHWKVLELKDHSEVVHFVMNMRNAFINLFAKHKNEFPGINGEALFLGTVLHSLDHALLEQNCADPLWLDVTSKRFGLMAEVLRLTLAGFNSDIPFLCINRKYRTAPGKFYNAVYQHAQKSQQASC